MRHGWKRWIGVVLVAAIVAGCKSKETSGGMAGGSAAPAAGSSAAAEKSLYDRLGGESGIKAVVDDFVANVGADARINKFFAHTDLDHLKHELVDQIGQASGGPQKYTGRDMKTAHAGMGIAEGDFNALVEDLTKSLDKFKVGEREKGELLAVLGPMKSDIVEK